MAVTFELDEKYTGFRTVEVPPAEEGGEAVTQEVPTRSISVTFTDGTITHQRDVNVCFDSEGEYDPDATLLRIEEVARGVDNKIAVGLISG